jgi:hypothetical protein
MLLLPCACQRHRRFQRAGGAHPATPSGRDEGRHDEHRRSRRSEYGRRGTGLGGLPRSAMYLMQGKPGSGKTTFALQFLLAGVARGERGLYITLSETRDRPCRALPRLVAGCAVAVRALCGPSAHITVLERPVRVTTLVSILRSAVITRQRQYQMRDLIEELRLSVERLDTNRESGSVSSTCSHTISADCSRLLEWVRS